MNYLKIFSPPHVVARTRLFMAPYLSPERRARVHGVEMSVDLRNYPGRCLWAYRDLYERDDIRLLGEIVQPGETVIDIGANAGIYTVKCAQLVGAGGRVIAFEGNPAEVPSLRRNVGAYPQVQVVEAFCSDGSFADHHWGSREVLVDDVVSGPVHFIKVDVDGIDLMVLQTCERILRESRPKLLVEIARERDYIKAHHGISSAREIFEWLSELGYQAHHMKPGFPPFYEMTVENIQNVLFTT